MLKRTSILICLAGVALVAGPASALQVGDKAPPISVSWIRGGPYDLQEGKGKNVFVLDFWATWCGPCRMSMPHLSELQKKYKDKGLVVIAVAMSDEPASLVKSFIERMGDKADFAVALDKANNTARSYMAALGVNGIPYSCVIDKDGLLAWHGSPLAGLDQVVEQCLAGTYNLKARTALVKYFETAIEADHTENTDQKKDLNHKAGELGKDVLKLAAKTPEVLDLLAWNILSLPMLKTRDLALAKAAAKMAFDVTEGKNASILDTYANVLWQEGSRQEAVELQRKAVALAKDEQLIAMLKGRLEQYEKDLKANPPTSAPATQASR